MPFFAGIAVMKSFAQLGMAIGLGLGVAQANSVVLKPAADTTLFRFFPGNNDGKDSTMIVGGISKSPSACRALVRFALGTNLPAGSVVTNVTLRLNVTREKGSSGAIQTRFHRVTQDWAEGGKLNQAGGATATAGEATWTDRKKGTASWSAPGATGDFATTFSASIPLDNTGVYTVASTAGLVADVQAWLTDPGTNFGWILVAQQEDTSASARRIATREAGSPAMALTIGFTAPSTPPTLPALTGVRTTDGQFELVFPAQANVQYQLQRRTLFDALPWADAGLFAQGLDGPITNRVRFESDPAFFRIVIKP